ncbi:hypothetical protein RHGRI_013142 [Rhododendron griersonianum]|uniref:RING-type E3 ubiquitin transferase n=1 Tax=Rhododendron griersonianum TaxID=479676 RepID=A0AAV6K4F9_9ERIC|nr:hypothetical protein RHGRI_013142 [Rhododendron griersonianum]
MDGSVKEEDEDDKDMEMCMSFEHRISDLPDYEHSREDNWTPEEEGIMHDGIFVMVQVCGFGYLINSYLSPGHYGTFKNGVIFPFVTPIAGRLQEEYLLDYGTICKLVGIDWQNPLEDTGIPLIVCKGCGLCGCTCTVVLPSLLFHPPNLSFTGLSGRHSYQLLNSGYPVEEICVICQENYADGEELGKLDWGHEFNFCCIKQWLVQKNARPLCKRAVVAI